jgi:hypothetical protein
MKLFRMMLAFVIFMQVPSAFGQCEKANFDHVQFLLDTQHLSVAFTMGLDSSFIRGILWTVLDANSQSIIQVDSSTFAYPNPDKYSPPNSIEFQLKSAIDPTHTYFVTALNVRYFNCPPATPSTAFAKLVMVQAKGDEKKPAIPFTITATKGRDDSDLYLSGLVQGADGMKASYTADIKAQFQLPIKRAATGANNKFRGGWWFVPSFDFKASTDPKSDGNSVTIAAALTHGFKLPSKVFTWNEIAPAFALESDKQYRAINTLAHLRTDFLMRGFGSGQLQLSLQPFFLLDAGGNVRSPLAGSFPGGIVRPGAGIHVYLNLFKLTKAGRIAFVESEYIRRWPLLAEPVFTQDKSGNLIFASLGTNPRDYVWTKFEFDFTDYLGMTIGYDYGQLPPVYTTVDSKYSVGFVVKTGLKYKPK